MIYIMNKDLETEGILTNVGIDAAPYFNDRMVENVETGSMTYTFETIGSRAAAKLLESEGYIVRPDIDGENLLLFKIRTISERKQEDGTIIKRVDAEGAELELLLDIVRPTVLTSEPAGKALTEVLGGTEWTTGVVEWLDLETFDFSSYPTVLSAVQEINERYGGDIVFRVEMRDGRIISRKVDLLQQRGDANAFRYDYKYDIQGVERIEDSSQLVTALIGVGASDANEKAITFTDIERTFTTADGTVVKKPKGQDFIANPAAFQRWARNGKHRFGVFKTEEKDPTALIKRTFKALEKYSEPSLTYAVDVLDLHNAPGYESRPRAKIGDYGDVIDHTFEPSLMVNARVIERVTSFTDPEADKVTLGNYTTYQADAIDIIDALRDTVRENAAKWGESGESIHKAATPPVNPKADDLWIDTTAEPNVLKRYDGAAWVKASPTIAADIGAETPQGAQDKADGAEQGANDYTDARELIIRDAFADFVQEIPGGGGTTIKQQATEPLDPVLDDLWIDTSVKPHVWRRYNGTAWELASATSLEDLAGVLKENQIGTGAVSSDKIATGAIITEKIAAGSITTQLITAAGLDAQVIKFGTMSGDRIFANSLDANRLKAGSVIAENITFTGRLAGASGTFSGSLNIGTDEAGIEMYGYEFISYNRFDFSGSDPTYERSIRIANGRMDFLYRDIGAGVYDVNASIEQTQYGMELTGDFVVNGLLRVGQNQIRPESVYFPQAVLIAESLEAPEFVVERNLLVSGETHSIHGDLELTGRFKATELATFKETYIPIMNNNTLFYFGATFDHHTSFISGRLEFNSNEPTRNKSESGVCGIGGIANGGRSAVAGTMVNFRTKKTYVPSNVSLYPTSSNAAVAFTDISKDGFWLYVNGDGTSLYKYWRGTYSA